jgi:hypothetical protein
MLEIYKNDDIKGVENWDYSGIRYDQNRNANEAIIKKAKTEMAKEVEALIRKDWLDWAGEDYDIPKQFVLNIIQILWSRVVWLENCGVSAYSALLEGLGVMGPGKYPEVNGQSTQFDDWLSDYLNDPKHDDIFSKGNAFDNRAMANYVTLTLKLFPMLTAVFKKWSWKEITEAIYGGAGALICKKEPGHYVAGISYNKTRSLILTSDSWSTSPYLKHKGWQEEIDQKEYETNTIGWAVILKKKQGL